MISKESAATFGQITFDSDKMEKAVKLAAKEIGLVVSGQKKFTDRTDLCIKVIRSFIRLRQDEVRHYKFLLSLPELKELKGVKK